MSRASNPGPWWFYIWFWVGLVPLSILFGPVWRAVNPLRSVGLLVGAGDGDGDGEDRQ